MNVTNIKGRYLFVHKPVKGEAFQKYFMAYKTEMQSLKYHFPLKIMKWLSLPMLGPQSCECTALGHPKPLLSYPYSGEVRVASASMSGFLLYHLSGKSEESRGESRISYCWVLLLILHTYCHLILLIQFIQHRTDLICN